MNKVIFTLLLACIGILFGCQTQKQNRAKPDAKTIARLKSLLDNRPPMPMPGAFAKSLPAKAVSQVFMQEQDRTVIIVRRVGTPGFIISMPARSNEVWVCEATTRLTADAVWRQVGNMGAGAGRWTTETYSTGMQFFRFRRVQ